MSGSRFAARLAAVVSTVLVAAAPLLVAGPASAAGNDFIWLTPHTVPDWPIRNDGNWGRTTNFLTLSVDGRYGLISAGSTSPQGGSSWTAVYLSDNTAGTLTLASVDPAGNRFSATVANVNPIISPYGTWMAWQSYDTAAGGTTTVYARNIRTGQVYRSPVGQIAESSTSVTDDGRVFGRFHAQSPVGTVTEVWDAPDGTVRAVTVAAVPGAFGVYGISGDGSTAVVSLGGQYAAVDLSSGAVSTLPIGPPTTTSVGALSQTGRFIGFSSRDPARNPEGLTKPQVYLFDRQTGMTSWISAPGVGGHTDPGIGYGLVSRSISDDGRYVIFGADSVFTVPPLDPAHAGEHVYYFAGTTFERDTRTSDTHLVVADYAYGIAPDAGTVQFDGRGLVPADNTGQFGVYLSGPPTNRVLPPSVSVTGVIDGDSYEFGAVPTAGCRVSDGLDGQLAPAPQTTGPVGPRSSAGLGSTTVSCAYTNSLGLTGSASAMYTIVDNTAPIVRVPADVTTTATSGAGATVSYAAATATDLVDGDLPVTCGHATATVFPVGNTTVTCTATDLAGNTAHASFTVTVVDTVPGTPTVSSVVPGDRRATITWLKPANSGSPIIGYTVTATPGGESCSTDSADELTCTITGLTNGVNYTFTVTARNAAGNSPPPSNGGGTGAGGSNGSGTPGPPPGPVTGVQPTLDPADGTRVTLHWLAASSDLPIIGYKATATPGGQFCTTDGALFCTITGLTNGADYTFTVVAINGAGASDPSPPAALPPTITAINPTHGPPGGGTTVTITGTHLTGATAVTFGATAATDITVTSATTLIATTPAGSPGTVDIRVTTRAGTSATIAADQYTYDPASDLATTLTSPGTVALGDAGLVTVTVSNDGPSPASQPTTTLTLDGAATHVLTATIPGGTCTIAANTVTCTSATLAAGASTTAVITTEPNAIGTTTLAATTHATEADPMTGNNTATTTVTTTNTHGCTIVGTAGDDTINGTSGNDVICALAGNDHVNAGNGDDVIYGGSGNDTLDGGNGNDTIYAGTGGSVLIGGNGNDTITGGIGNDTIYGDNGNDTINAGAGNDTVYGGNGDDTIDAGDGTDTIDGGNGNDTCPHTETASSCISST